MKLTWQDFVAGTIRAAARAEEFRAKYQKCCGDQNLDWTCGLPPGHPGPHKTHTGGAASWSER